MSTVNPEAIHMADSCLICKSWRPNEDNVDGVCFKHHPSEAVVTTAAADKCALFNKDCLREMLEVSRIATFLEDLNEHSA